jgi:hypothetical protein
MKSLTSGQYRSGEADYAGSTYSDARRERAAFDGVSLQGGKFHDVNVRDAESRRTGPRGQERGFGAAPCSASSSFAIWLRCTSSGPSAKRSVRACA